MIIMATDPESIEMKPLDDEDEESSKTLLESGDSTLISSDTEDNTNTKTKSVDPEEFLRDELGRMSLKEKLRKIMKVWFGSPVYLKDNLLVIVFYVSSILFVVR